MALVRVSRQFSGGFAGVSGPCSQELAVISSLRVLVSSTYTILCLPAAASSERIMHEARSM